MLSVVDATSGKKVADIKVDGETLEAMALESSSPKMYVNNKAKNRVDVVDREKREVLASWPITKGKTNVAMALDEANHRLFVACRSGDLVVFDTTSGKEIATLPITKGVDDLVFDKDNKRIYAAADGFVDVYQQESPDNYKLAAKVPSGPSARTARLVSELSATSLQCLSMKRLRRKCWFTKFNKFLFVEEMGLGSASRASCFS